MTDDQYFELWNYSYDLLLDIYQTQRYDLAYNFIRTHTLIPADITFYNQTYPSRDSEVPHFDPRALLDIQFTGFCDTAKSVPLNNGILRLSYLLYYWMNDQPNSTFTSFQALLKWSTSYRTPTLQQELLIQQAILPSDAVSLINSLK